MSDNEEGDEQVLEGSEDEGNRNQAYDEDDDYEDASAGPLIAGSSSLRRGEPQQQQARRGSSSASAGNNSMLSSATAGSNPHKIVPPSVRHLRACLNCKLIKNIEQFEKYGCENCPQLDMKNDKQKVLESTSTSFEG